MRSPAAISRICLPDRRTTLRPRSFNSSAVVPVAVGMARPFRKYRLYKLDLPLYFRKSVLWKVSMPRQPSGRLAVLDLVQRDGPVSADAMAGKLGLTTMAVRQHLSALKAEGQAEVRRGSAATRPAGAALAHHGQGGGTVRRRAFGARRRPRRPDEEGLRRDGHGPDPEIAHCRTGKKLSRPHRHRALAEGASSTGSRASARTKATWPRCGAIRRPAASCSSRTIARSAPQPGSAPGSAAKSLRLFHRLLGPGVKVERVSHIPRRCGALRLSRFAGVERVVIGLNHK